MIEVLLARYPHWCTVALMCVGLYGIVGRRNLLKKVIGLNIFQTAVILFYVNASTRRGATVPVIPDEMLHGAHGAHGAVHADLFVNPVPHVLMLTAIVVGVATTGVALALIMKIYRHYGTVDEVELLERMREGPAARDLAGGGAS